MIKNYSLIPVKALYNECSMPEYDVLLENDALLDEYRQLEGATRLLNTINLQPSDCLIENTLLRCLADNHAEIS